MLPYYFQIILLKPTLLRTVPYKQTAMTSIRHNLTKSLFQSIFKISSSF